MARVPRGGDGRRALKGAEIEIGGYCVAKVSGRLVALRVNASDDDPRTLRRR